MTSASTQYHAIAFNTAESETATADHITQEEGLVDREELHGDPSPTSKQLSTIDAMIHLVKGNLGPGCLNLPHAFSLAGWATGSILFAVIALQGIYSMCLLVHCKNVLNQRTNHGKVYTFMDVSAAALGHVGGRIVEVFLFILQAGVCCVFLSLVNTNLMAAFPNLPVIASIGFVTIVLMAVVTLRFLKDLIWLCATANAFMVVAVLTAAVAGLMNYFQQDPTNIVIANSSPTAMITFTCDMFFAFEGIGLVLPVENSFGMKKKNFSQVLVSSMSVVASLFILIGISASIGFPGIRSGSVTAFLQREFPHVVWYSLVNFLVMIAIVFTFPLQLTPAMQVLDQWLDAACGFNRVENIVSEPSDRNRSIDDGDIDMTPVRHLSGVQDDDKFQDEILSTSSSERQMNSCNSYSWLIRRWAMVLFCSVVVLVVNDVAILMSFFGAVGQTGLAGMPCAVHLALQYQGIAPVNTFCSLLNIMILLFCIVVMLTGCYSVIVELI